MDFLQADDIFKVGGVVEAVDRNMNTDDLIEGYLGLNSGGRQGRYYRLAAELLNLVTNSNNIASLAPIGSQYLSLPSQQRPQFLGQLAMQYLPIFQQGVNFIRQSSPTDSVLKSWFIQECLRHNYAESTAKRRYSSFTHWLLDTGLVTLSNGIYS